jgi:hypothetical protein
MKMSVHSAVRWPTSQQGISLVTGNGSECVAVADPDALKAFGRVLLLHADGGPDFIDLNLRALQVAHDAVLVHRAGFANVSDQLKNRVLRRASHPAGRVDAHALRQRS